MIIKLCNSHILNYFDIDFCFLTEPKGRDQQYLDELSMLKSLRLQTARVHLRQHISSGVAVSGIAGRSKLNKNNELMFFVCWPPMPVTKAARSLRVA